MTETTKGRVFLLAAFLCPVIAGVVFMAFAGAPSAYLIANVGAGLLVAMAFMLAPQMDRRTSLFAVTVIVPALLGFTFLGPAIHDVHRWIALGPLKLHGAMLALPLLATQLFRHERRVVAAVAALTALIVALQPDRASAFAVFLLSLCWLGYRYDRWSLVTILVSGTALAVTILKTDSLPPVRFVEYVLEDAASVHIGVVACLLTSIAVPIAMPVYAGRRGELPRLAPAVAWSACLTGYFFASLVGPYPTPLLGYGVSPILGFGLALAMLGRDGNEAAWTPR